MVMDDEVVNIKDIGKKYKLSADDVFSALLSYGNKTNQKLLVQIDGQTFTPKWLFNEMISVESRICDYIIQEDEVKKTRQLLSSVTKPALYFLYDGEELVYIGQSREVLGRIATHIRLGEKVFDSFAIVHVPDAELLDIERENIREYRPKYNSLSNLDNDQQLRYVLRNCAKTE